MVLHESVSFMLSCLICSLCNSATSVNICTLIYTWESPSQLSGVFIVDVFVLIHSLFVFQWVIPFLKSPWGDKVSMLNYTYPHKPLRKIMWPYAITRLIARFRYGLMADLFNCCKHEKSMVMFDTESPGVIKQQNNSNSDSFLSLFISVDLGTLSAVQFLKTLRSG